MKVKGKILSFLGLVAIYFVFLPLASVGAEKVVVFLKSEAQVKGSYILLEEIAEKIRAEESLKESILKTRIGSSPLPGRRRILNRDYVLVRLYQRGLSPDEIIVKGSQEVVVTRELPSSGFLDNGKFFLDGNNLLVRRGNLVKLILETGNLKIITQGKALKSGKKGDIIEVLNISSFRKIKGEIIAPYTVKVNFIDNF